MNQRWKQTEVGMIPADWDVEPFGNIITDFRGGAPLKPSDFTSAGIRVLPKGAVGRAGWLEIKDTDLQYCSAKYAADHHRNQVDETFAIVVLRDLVPSGPTIGLMVQIREPGRFVLAQGVYGFKVNGRAVPGYLVQLSNTRWYRKLANSIMVGSTQVHITNAAFKNARVPLPSLSEQHAINETLNDTNALVESLRDLLAKKLHIKQGTVHELLTGQKRLPGFSGQWEVQRLGDVATFHKGKGLPKSALDPFGADPCIHYGELFTQYSETIHETLSRTNRSADFARSLANDVLMPTSDVTPNGLAKASCISLDGVILGGDILIIRTDRHCVFGSFLSFVIRHAESQILQLVTGTTVFHLYAADMKKFIFAMPPVVEQQAIVAVLDDMDAEIAALEKRLVKALSIKQGMVQELLTGTTRLI